MLSHEFSQYQGSAAARLNRFFAARPVPHQPTQEYTESLASFLTMNFFKQSTTALQRWEMIKANCKNSAFRNTLYSNWQATPRLLEDLAADAGRTNELASLNVYQNINRYNYLRRRMIPNVANRNAWPLSYQQTLVMKAISGHEQQMDHELSAQDAEFEINVTDTLNDEAIIEYYNNHKVSIKSDASQQYRSHLLTRNDVPSSSMLNYYLYDLNKPAAPREQPFVAAPTPINQWRYFAPAAVAYALTAASIMVYCSFSNK
jgi:hypothetical protein